MPFVRTAWEDHPSLATPMTAAQLNRMEDGIYRALSHSGGIRNTAEFLERYPASTTGGLAEAISDLAGSDGVVFMAPHSHPIDADYTIPATTHVIFAKGAICAVASGKTLAISGTMQGGLSQHFSGDGSVDLGENPAYMEWFHDGGADHGPAFQKAMNASANVTAPQKSYTIGTSCAIPRSYQRLFVYGDITSSLGAGEAMFTFASKDRAVIKIYGLVDGVDDTADFMRWTGGISSRIYVHAITDFRYGFHFKQEAEGVTFTENVLEYNLIYSCTKGVYVSSAPGGQAIMPCEGLQLLGGFIASCGQGVHIEADTNAKYLYATGAIDFCTNNYLNESTGGRALLLLKYILETNCTFGPGDIIVNARIGQIRQETDSIYPAHLVNHRNPPGYPLGLDYLQVITAPTGPGDANKKEGVWIGTDLGLSAAKSVALTTFYDAKTQAAAGEKEGGLQLVYRRNDDVSAIAGGKVVIRKEAGSNLCSIGLCPDDTNEKVRMDENGNLIVEEYTATEYIAAENVDIGESFIGSHVVADLSVYRLGIQMLSAANLVEHLGLYILGRNGTGSQVTAVTALPDTVVELDGSYNVKITNNHGNGRYFYCGLLRLA